MTPERYHRITSVLNRRQPDLTVITDEVHKHRNLSAIVRNCDAVGIDQIYSVVPQTGYQTYSGTSASAEKWVEVAFCSSPEEPITALKQQGFQIITASIADTAVDYRTVDYTVPTALVLGAEVKGISAVSESLCDVGVTLPMLGMVESYNVSVACALILAEAQTQRQKQGMYNKRRLSSARYDYLYFRWAHPKLAEFCDAKQIPYPPVGDDGEVIDLSNWYRSVRESG